MRCEGCTLHNLFISVAGHEQGFEISFFLGSCQPSGKAVRFEMNDADGTLGYLVEILWMMLNLGFHGEK